MLGRLSSRATFHFVLLAVPILTAQAYAQIIELNPRTQAQKGAKELITVAHELSVKLERAQELFDQNMKSLMP